MSVLGWCLMAGWVAVAIGVGREVYLDWKLQKELEDWFFRDNQGAKRRFLKRVKEEDSAVAEELERTQAELRDARTEISRLREREEEAREILMAFTKLSELGISAKSHAALYGARVWLADKKGGER